MDQVEGGLAPDQAPGDGPDVAEVGLVDLDPVRPLPVRSLPGERTRQRTAYPASSRRGTSRPPMYPVAPVIATRLGGQQGGVYWAVRKPHGHKSAHFPQAWQRSRLNAK